VPERRVTIVNELGLHARAAAKFVKLAQTFPGASVRVAKDGQQVSGSSILGLMMLAAGPGDAIEISADGADGGPALAALIDLVSRGFDE
jgi:phosphocarrier protein